MSYDLKTLAQNREALLLAEVAAWLHDWQKVIPFWKRLEGSVDPGSVSSILADLNLPDPLQTNASTSIKEMVEQGRDPSKAKHSSDWRIKLIGVCHGVAHVDKPEEQGLGQSCLLLATVFGYEVHPRPSFRQLKRSVQRLCNDWQRGTFLRDLREPFTNAVGDTRRPINEVTLWSWAASTAAFYKAASAQAILEDKLKKDHPQWHILRVAVNGPSFYNRAARLPDLLARRDALSVALNRIQTLLEKTYPIGNEVYRDETGSAFLVPHLSSDDENGGLLKALLENEIRSAFNCDSIAGEITPHITISPADRHGLILADELAKPIIELQSDPDRVTQWWQDRSDDICTVCGLRPQGPSSKSQDRGVCDTCEQRRAERAKAWAGELETTIWTDEIADINGRLALVAGQFDLQEWLNGKLVRTLLVTDPKSGDPISKNPSFARIRRVWETTHRFWQQTRDGFSRTVGSASPRLEIIPQGRDELDLGDFHTYELVLPGDVRLSMVWDSDKRRFITCDNLDYLAKPEQLGKPVQDVLTQGQTLTVEEPVGYGSKNKVWGEITLANVHPLPGTYTTAIPILTEPRTFIALVPANKALDVIQAIKQKYEREMGKVRNRLPLHLGAVYFHRRTPLRAALDTGRRMLAFTPAASDGWKVTKVADSAKDTAPGHLQDAQFTCWREVTLQSAGRTITWRVPLRMGDGSTEDAWYPYVCVEKPAPGEPIDQRDRRFQAPNPWSADDDWLVHAGDLKPGDVVYFSPATFDFEHLDTTARRFEVSYKASQRRGDAKAQRPYLLDDLARIEDVWQTLCDGLSTSQIKALETLIETKRRDWKKHKGAQALALPDDAPFRQLCHDALANAEWREKAWQEFTSEKRKQLVRAAVSGMLADAIELHLTIAKEEIEPKHKETI